MNKLVGFFIRPLIYLLLLQPVIVLCRHGGHNAHHNHHHHHFSRSLQTQGITSNASSPEFIVSQALIALAKINKLRLQHPSFNIYQFQNGSEAASKGRSAPLLEYGDEISNGTDVKTRRQILTSNSTMNGTSLAAYTIPPELIEAARVLAEANTRVPEGNHTDVANAMKAKYGHKNLDTNRPEKLTQPEGLLSTFGNGHESNSTTVSKRDSGYWMVDMAQRGSAPYASSGYKVWRNVKDYGAKGDGTSDDTAAINAAIQNGERCGETCGSSTRVPAVVYFPPGTYLVSSPIIQYYNTQFLGDPHSVPTILAAPSFVGLGVITSDVYVSDDVEWYIVQSNFLRSIRNFKMDIRLTDPYASICAIHWQVAQGTSLENIEFYMQYNSDIPGNTQQGIYMENGSGGFLADLTFVGGNFGAYMGNQQFTTSGLVFVYCNTAIQIHWDWAWTMQDFVIDGCNNGLVIVGGEGGPQSTGQGVGSLILADAIIANTANGILTTLLVENATSFLLQNVGFFNVQTAIKDEGQNRVIVAGGSELVLESWGFGKINNATGHSSFINGANIPGMKRTTALLGAAYDKMKPNLFTRRRPNYYDVPQSNIMNVKALGAKGDGVTDDTAVLNAILSGAANTSSIVYFPYGVYIVRDTIKVPIGSRIIGQAWSQIMGKGAKFQDEAVPRAVVQVGRPGDIGIIEIQDMMFTVGGPTSGAVIVEWNAAQATQGSVGLWDSHIRVGGAAGSDLQLAQCPKLSGQVNPKCKAASLMLHLKPNSTAYIENMWAWVADHDLDLPTQDQIDIYAGRGVLIESKLAWLWSTASEHAVLYQYQLSSASNILLVMAQTESPYFQPTPSAPLPFQTGLFSNDPKFSGCTSGDLRCATSWAVRIIDSSTIYILGAGLYSWFNDYDQTCLHTEDCQSRGFEIQQSFDIWIYNLCTKAMVEMISPTGSIPTYARDNVNGFLSSILAWLQGANNISGERKFKGFQIYTQTFTRLLSVPGVCKTALTQTIQCDDQVQNFQNLGYRGALESLNQTESVCDKGCGASLKNWFDNVASSCNGFNITDAHSTLAGGRMWAGYNETCLMDTGKSYCNDVIDTFTVVKTYQDMPSTEMCSFCYTNRLAMMQKNAYSIYDARYQEELVYINQRCGLTFGTDIPLSLILAPNDEFADCGTDNWHTTTTGETCDIISTANSVSSAALFMANQYRVSNCSSNYILPAGIRLCLPPTCGSTYKLLDTEEQCYAIESSTTNEMMPGDVQRYNPWVGYGCVNLLSSSVTYGKIICLSPQNGPHAGTIAGNDTTTPVTTGGYTEDMVAPPMNVNIPAGTTLYCGKWHVAVAGETCTSICVMEKIPSDLFLAVNTALGIAADGCTAHLKEGSAYCVGPMEDWKAPYVVVLRSTLSETMTFTYGSFSDQPSTATSTSSTKPTSSSTTTSTTTNKPTSTALPVSLDGKCGSASSKGATCAGSSFGQCCSVKGNCGTTAAFCATSNLCQSGFGTCNPTSTDGKCGSASSTSASCAGSTFGQCCSVKGNCGTTAAFCATNNLCQSAFGTCYPTTTDGKCGKASTIDANAMCSGSKFGQCCSVKGNCGDTDAFCKTSNLCQLNYGICT